MAAPFLELEGGPKFLQDFSKMQASFASLGQLVKFAYDATGVLPKKRDEKTALTDKDVKRIQKQLERLADEKGSLLDRCGELIRTLSYELAGTIQNPKISLAIGDCCIDLLNVDNHVVRDEGTYLSPRESLQWFASAYAVPRLVLSVQKHLVRFNIAADGLIHPEDVDWYLPSISDDSITWPLEKAMQWIYEHCNTSPTHFHCAGKAHLESDTEMRQNLENASNWRRSQNLPSWAGLHWNFSRSIDRLVVAEGPASRAITAKEKESMLYVLFLARLSTYVTKQAYEIYGKDVLIDLLSRFKRQRDWLSKDVKILKTTTTNYLKQENIAQHDHDAIWFELSERYWRWFADRSSHCGKTLQSLIETTSDHSIPEAQIHQLCEQYSEYTVRSALDLLTCASELKNPPFFAEALFKGIDLSKSSTTTIQEIDAYETDTHKKGVLHCIEWMVHWNRALLHYRNRQDSEAFKHISIAFEMAKYSAGSNQYKIVNQFIEIAAKNDSWLSFKHGVAWAMYLGISVRWLREDEPTEDNLRGIFDLMKLAHFRYAV